MTIERHISQIFLSDKEEKLPEYLRKATSSISRYYCDHIHKIYNNEELREFIKFNYNSEVLWAYDSLRPFSYKSDLGRFCILYKHGGWYFDIAIKCLLKFEVNEEIDMISFRDEQRHSKTSWAAAGGIIWSKANNEILLSAIEGIVKNCQDKWYGRTPLCPTGPALFGEAIAKNNRYKNIVFGDLVRPNVPFTRKNLPIFKNLIKSKFILPNNQVIALVKPAKGGDLKSLGMTGSNNYNDYWHNKSVYNDIKFLE
tara:strand:- start:2199 stop:2963 length:765 start_codon:yes stop_codon:yes gene_type:complete